MILTGKCKEDFVEYCKIYSCEYENNKRGEFFWFGNETDLLHKYCDKFLNALIIEFFDSVGIFINVSPNYLDQDRKYSDGDFKAIIN